MIDGSCTLDPVRDAFAANFAEHDEIGAAIAVTVNGEPVVDLWGGHRDAERTQPWQADTVVNIWSTTKGVAATCFAMLVDRGALAYDDPVAKHWPEFAANGKERVTVAQLLSHQAGLSGFTTPATMTDLLGGSVSADRLARQAPIWAPGVSSGYHAITIGILATELFRRVEGRSLKRFVADELHPRFDVAIGLAPDQEHRRAAIVAPAPAKAGLPIELNPAQRAAMGNPPLDPASPNSPEWRAADLPSANGHATARGLAGLYAALLDGLVRPETLAQATQVRIEGVDLVLGLPCRWAAGYLRNADGLYGPSEQAFGHSGWGGSFAFADPENGVAMAYTMNRMGSDIRVDPRGVSLVRAVYAAL